MPKVERHSHSEAPVAWCQDDDCGAAAAWLAVCVYDAGLIAGALACEVHVQDMLDVLNEAADELPNVEGVLLVDLKRAPAWNRVRRGHGLV